jgi:hypothetical protein
MIEQLKKLFGSKADVTPAQTEAPKEAKAKKPRSKPKTAKELATEKGEPYISIVSIELDPDNIGNGAFELDWNDKFVANLVRAGYQGKTDQQIVDQWFQEICRNILLENYEQEQADPEFRQPGRKNLGSGRTEFS